MTPRKEVPWSQLIRSPRQRQSHLEQATDSKLHPLTKCGHWHGPKVARPNPSCPSKTYLGSNIRLFSLLAKDTRWEARAVAVSITVSPHGENLPLFFLLDTDHRLNSPHGVSRVVSNSIQQK